LDDPSWFRPQFDTNKAMIRFQANKPLLAALMRKLIKARMTENVGNKARQRRASPLLAARANPRG
jgi:uncharacterized protein YdhG (YjbR/CyaY superfamily)